MAKTAVSQRVKEAVAHQPKEEEDNMPYLWSPAGYMLLLLAFTIDMLGLLLGLITYLTGGLAAPIEFLPDIIGIATLGMWFYFKTGETAISGRLKKVWKKQRWAWIAELAPLAGTGPWWTLWVIKSLKK